MKKNSIHTLLSRFFENNFSQEVCDKFASWFVYSEHTNEKDKVMKEIWDSLPLTTDFTSLTELKKVNNRIYPARSKLYRRFAAIAAIIILPLLGIVSTIWYNYGISSKIFTEMQMVECFVPNGEQKQITLPDGSIAWLNAGSILIYPKSFSGKSRPLYLSGEGKFKVAKDEKKTFIVKTKYIDIQALGTTFNVHSYPSENKTTVILESGKVKVNDKTEFSTSVILNPNEQLVYNHVSNSFAKSEVDAPHLSSWTKGYMIFQQESLSNIFRALERRYNVEINYNDSKFANLTFTVRFHVKETLEEALEVLKRIGADFKYSITDSNVFIK